MNNENITPGAAHLLLECACGNKDTTCAPLYECSAGCGRVMRVVAVTRDLDAVMQMAAQAADAAADRDYRAVWSLGMLILKLQGMRADLPVYVDINGDAVGSMTCPHSYRGFYRWLAFEPCPAGPTVKDVLQEATSVLNEQLEGYKGGLFLMHQHVKVFVSHYGASSGWGIVGVDQKQTRCVLRTQHME